MPLTSAVCSQTLSEALLSLRRGKICNSHVSHNNKPHVQAEAVGAAQVSCFVTHTWYKIKQLRAPLHGFGPTPTLPHAGSSCGMAVRAVSWTAIDVL